MVFDRIKWRAQIKFKNRLYGLGRFPTEEGAARAYDAAVTLLFRNPVLNFLPESGAPNPDRQARVKYGSLVPRPGAVPQEAVAAAAAAGRAPWADYRLLQALVDEGKREAQQLERLEGEGEGEEGEEEQLLPPPPPPPPPQLPPPPPPLTVQGPVYQV